jgi:hypothetical protein
LDLLRRTIGLVATDPELQVAQRVQLPDAGLQARPLPGPGPAEQLEQPFAIGNENGVAASRR